MPRKSPVGDEVVASVGRLLRRGLPVTPASSDEVLLGLRGIVARAVDPADEASRTAALNGTLRGLLARFPDTRYASAARALFGLPPAEPGQNLTIRRERAAAEAGHEVHHFRKRVEPKLIEKIAWELLADADRFTRSPMIAPRLAPVTGRQPVQADPFAWEVAEHEEQLSRLWSAIYAARAELLALERLISLRADRMDILRIAVTAAWRWAAARAEVISYTTAFAPKLEASVDELVALAGWTPALTEAQASRLTEAATGGASREQFIAALHGETGLGNAWTEDFLARTPSPREERTVVVTSTNPALAAALAAASGDPRRYVITGGPSSGKDDLIEAVHAAGIPCMVDEPGREIYRKHRERIGRHLRKEDRREYSLEVLEAFIAEYTAHTRGIRFYNRGIPDGYGWEGFFGLKSTPQVEEATRRYRYDAVFVLDPLDTFEDPDDIVWAKDREIRRVHELIVQGYYDAGYEPVFVSPDSASARLDFICANLRLPKPSRGA